MQLEREDEELSRRVDAATRHLVSLERECKEMALRLDALESQVALQETQVHAHVQATL